MNPIDKNELFGHLSDFLKSKGVELKEGAYTRRIQTGCNLLADTINLSQRTMARAKTGVDQKLDRMRQVIHEKTAPKAPPVQSQPEPSPQPAKAVSPKSRAPKAKAAKAKAKSAARPSPKKRHR
jgi:hypothetical protein